ncbi:ribosomal large subunit pseudouridine synthase B [Pontibacillus halophilus JSM 076056 = DSM 19796]|uniref:Pseudouridine synthase n=1 Tax=Pontibacillus halophilus JSM 076056 = DSM 19796 TaxID=1385510 RepID=A0A0A5I8P2_9BACI|nr:pseudouridine synthase [Pontibacillus halophilus]KGX92207.1 ribosomal large subunit pseudouridine synthase B [Pontibacillus halophilus JSM 076056 = DSM 19796]
MSEGKERLQKVIANSGVTSRRKAETLIVEGKVQVNGKTVKELGTKVSPNDEIVVEGVPLEKEEPVHYLLYKPRGVISSVKDDKGRKVVTDFLPEVEERIYPVGRLDYDTSGLIVLTNDGDFAQSLMHPKHELDKVYVAKLKGIPSKEQLRQLTKGVYSDGDKLKAIRQKLLSADRQKGTSIVELVLHEGKNRQVRRMFEALGFKVDKLKREQYGFLTTEGLQPGEARKLTPYEVKRLRNMSEQNVN